MLLRQLEYFIQICKHGSFTRAAEMLLVSQPTLSQQIRLLEREFGTPLFYRMGRGVETTEAGKILLEKGKAIFQLIGEAKEETATLFQNQKSLITIGILAGDLMTYLLPKFLEIDEIHPDITLKFIEIEGDAKPLLHDKINIGITTSRLVSPEKEIVSQLLFEEELVLVVPEEHFLAKKSEINFQMLENLLQAITVNDPKLGNHLNELAKKAGINLKIQIEHDSACLTSLVNLLYAKKDVTIMPRPLIESYHYSGIKMIPLIDPKPNREIMLMYHKEKLTPLIANTLIPYMINLTKNV